MSESQLDIESETPCGRKHEIIYSLPVVGCRCHCLRIERSLAPEHQQVFAHYGDIYVKYIAQPFARNVIRDICFAEPEVGSAVGIILCKIVLRSALQLIIALGRDYDAVACHHSAIVPGNFRSLGDT